MTDETTDADAGKIDKIDFANRLEDLIDEFIDQGGERDEVIAALDEKAAALKDEKGADAA